MSIVLVHGNPETDAIWGDLVGELADLGATDPILLSPPGFRRWQSNGAFRRPAKARGLGYPRNQRR